MHGCSLNCMGYCELTRRNCTFAQHLTLDGILHEISLLIFTMEVAECEESMRILVEIDRTIALTPPFWSVFQQCNAIRPSDKTLVRNVTR